MLKKMLWILIFSFAITLLINCSEEKKKPEPQPKKEVVKEEPKKTTPKKVQKPKPKQVTGRYKDVNTNRKSSHIKQGGPNKIYWDEGAKIWRKAE